MPINKKIFNLETKLKKHKVYDCFMFSNELELLNFRFEYLSPYVDFFVLVESRKTTQGNPKPLFYNDNKSKFKKYRHKVKHLVFDDFPTGAVPHTIETIQRNAMISCLVDCDAHDLILISDLDEIPNLNKMPKKLLDGVVYHFLQDQLIYFANVYKEKHIIWEGGTKVVKYKTIRDNLLDEAFVHYGPTFLKEYNEDTTLTKVRLHRKTKFIYNGGYHLTYFGGVDRIIQKMKTFSHPELIQSGKFTKEFINQNLSNNIDIFDTNQKIYSLPDSEFVKLLKKFLSEDFFNESCITQNKFAYQFFRISEIVLIFLRSLLRERYLFLRSIIWKFWKKI